MDTNYELHHTTSRPLQGAPLASAADYAACRQVMRSASKNYSSASNYLPAHLLPHVEALYALMRVGDDRVDVSHQGFATALAAIDDWEDQYHQAFEHHYSPHPVMRAYLDTALRFSIPEETMHHYFHAMRMDLTQTRFATFEHLVQYMQGSAIPVGRAMLHILGVRQPWTYEQALPGADALSIAMQCSNFWRDIDEDFQRGRVYLPLEDLQKFGVSEADLAGRRSSARLASLLEFEFQRTEMYYAQARSAVPMLQHGRWAVMSALEIYHAILDELRARRYAVFGRRAGAGQLKKLALAAKAGWQLRSG